MFYVLKGESKIQSANYSNMNNFLRPKKNVKYSRNKQRSKFSESGPRSILHSWRTTIFSLGRGLEKRGPRTFVAAGGPRALRVRLRRTIIRSALYFLYKNKQKTLRWWMNFIMNEKTTTSYSVYDYFADLL